MATGTPFTDFTNHFLIAMPGMEDQMFAGGVVYVCQHSPNGAMGLMVNKATDVDMGELFRKVDLPLARAGLADQIVLQGGPVQTERGFVLHDPVVSADMPAGETAYVATLRVPGGLEMTTSRDVLEAISIGRGPDRLTVALGCSVWSAGQLESEIARNGWLTAPASAEVIFDAPLAERHARALALLGVQAWMLAPGAGHA